MGSPANNPSKRLTGILTRDPAPASYRRGRGFAMRGGEAARVDGEGDVWEGLGEREGVDPDFPDVVPGADVEGRGDGLPCGAGVEVREFDGDVADAGGPLCDAQLAGTRGHVTAILTAHILDAGADPRLTRHAPTLPRRHHRICFPLYHRRLTST